MSSVIQLRTAVADYDDPHLSSKRKLDAYDDYFAPTRPRRGDASYSSSDLPASSSNLLLSLFPTSPGGGYRRFPSALQFFVKTLSPGRTIVVHADPDDTVDSVLDQLQASTGVPAADQRLLYKGRQLAAEQTLKECRVERDSVLHVVCRMRSTLHPLACHLTDVIVEHVSRLCRDGADGRLYSLSLVTTLVDDFQRRASDRGGTHSDGLDFYRAFVTCSGPSALVMLYLSPRTGNKQCAEFCINSFLYNPKSDRDMDEDEKKKPPNPKSWALPVVLEMCKLLRMAVHHDDPLYCACRTSLASLLVFWLPRRGEIKELHAVPDLLLFIRDVATRLCKGLEANDPLLGDDVKEFSSFLHPLRNAILKKVGYMVPMVVPFPVSNVKNMLYFAEVIEQLHAMYVDLLAAMDRCLMKQSGEDESSFSGSSEQLVLLKELYDISKLFMNSEDRFWDVLRSSRTSVCTLIVKFADRSDDHQWLLQHSDVTDFQSRRHLVLMMFPEVKEDAGDLLEMLIDRSNLLPESFEYIGRAEPSALHASIFMEFKNEEATGPGVLREWFYLVVQAIFNQNNALFLACPSDRRRFYPNPASKVDSMHLDYFAFSGRVIALALMHKIQVGVVFDRVFYLQLAGKDITLDDIRDADPWMYGSCKQILDMDPEFVDSDALGLTFARDVEELGSIKVVELCPGGKNLVVNSWNREEYVNLLITHCFVTSISEQVSHFAQGFGEVLSDTMHELFFQCLEHGDLDMILYGSQSAICVEDWKAHIEYNGYKDTDPQILWFWQIVANMSEEQKKVLLFYWTSIKYLPVEGFRGLASRLYIYKSAEPFAHLPTSHTCFYRLCFPPYPSLAIMQNRLHLIAQEHVGCSFGTW